MNFNLKELRYHFSFIIFLLVTLSHLQPGPPYILVFHGLPSDLMETSVASQEMKEMVLIPKIRNILEDEGLHKEALAVKGATR